MERRQAVALAATASALFFLGAAGLTANAAILGDGDGGGVGTVSPIGPDATTGVPGGAEEPEIGAAPEPSPSSADASTSTGASSVAGDGGYGDDDDHEEQAEHEDDEHEGGDDDD